MSSSRRTAEGESAVQQNMEDWCGTAAFEVLRHRRACYRHRSRRTSQQSSSQKTCIITAARQTFCSARDVYRITSTQVPHGQIMLSIPASKMNPQLPPEIVTEDDSICTYIYSLRHAPSDQRGTGGNAQQGEKQEEAAANPADDPLSHAPVMLHSRHVTSSSNISHIRQTVCVIIFPFRHCQTAQRLKPQNSGCLPGQHLRRLLPTRAS